MKRPSARYVRPEDRPRRGNSHGLSHTPAYFVWVGMIQRCRNPNNPMWSRYGGRGIKVCERWNSFANFLADMGQPPRDLTLDRIDNDGGYEPGNCRWATQAEQQQNRSSTKLDQGKVEAIRVRLAAGDSLAPIARDYGVSYQMIREIKAGRSWKTSAPQPA